MVTLRQQIAQMLIMGFDGTEISETSSIKNWLTTEALGGVILFDYDMRKGSPEKNMVNYSQIKELTTQLRSLASRSNPAEECPLFIAVDYEGGAVDRIRRFLDDSPALSPKQYAVLSEQEQQNQAHKMALNLKDLGFNLNFAPVVDLNRIENEGIIGKLGRSFSSDSLVVAKTAGRFVKVFAEHGIACCYKHFPGHGSAAGDTHHGFVDVTSTFTMDELEPYSLLLAEEFPSAMIMTAHVINKQLDDSGLPATLSKTILTGLLREKMGFDGVIISDDLQMNAISQHFTQSEALRLTINAGADMLIFANQLGFVTPAEIIDCIENLVFQKAIDPARIRQAYQRILRLKQRQTVVS